MTALGRSEVMAVVSRYVPWFAQSYCVNYLRQLKESTNRHFA
jgi:hypothetical protein